MSFDKQQADKKNILPNMFENICVTNDYVDLMNDTSIKGRFKYIISYNPGNKHRLDPGSILLHFLMQYCHENTLFEYNISNNRQSVGWRSVTEYNKQKYDDITGMRVRLPSTPYKNLECKYNGKTLWLSNIYVSQNVPDGSQMPPCKMILSIDSDEKNHDEWMKTNWMSNMMKESKMWYMKTILGEDYDQDDYIDIYTFDEGYWELKKGNRKRCKETLFIDDTFYDSLIKKITKFSHHSTKSIYERLNLPYKFNILLHGPPGTGKTSFIEIMAAELKRDIRFMQITPKITDEQFSSAVSNLGPKDILVCEDIDCLFIDRKESDRHKNAMTFSGLLNCFDGINGGKNGLIVFLTTNYKCRLDKALTRPGRIDLLQEFEYMTKESLSKMVKFYFEEHFNQSDFDKLYNNIKTFNITGAIMSQFLLGLLIEQDYELYNNWNILKNILEDNSYEDNKLIEASIYS